MQTAVSPNQLVVDHLKYAEALTVAFIDQLNLRPLITLEEALSFANAGLTAAAHRFKAKVGRTGRSVPFTTFSFHRIRGAVIDGIRQSQRNRHGHQLLRAARRSLEVRTAPLPSYVPLSPAGPESLESVSGGERQAGLRDLAQAIHDEGLHALAARHAITKAIRQLPEIEQQVILLHYYEDLPCERLAARLGISGSYALRLRNKALRSLREALKDFGTAEPEGALQ